MSSSHPREAPISEPVPCPECGKIEVISVVETCRLADGLTVKRSSSLQVPILRSPVFSEMLQSTAFSKSATAADGGTIVEVSLALKTWLESVLSKFCAYVHRRTERGWAKQTFAREFLPWYVHCREFLNADLLAAGISPFDPDTGRFRRRTRATCSNEGVDSNKARTSDLKPHWREKHVCSILRDMKERRISACTCSISGVSRTWS